MIIKRSWAALRVGLLSVAMVASLAVTGATAASAAPQPAVAPRVIPALQNWTPASGGATLTGRSRIVLDGGDPNLVQTGELLARELHQAHGWNTPVVHSLNAAGAGDIVLQVDSGSDTLGNEGYTMQIDNRVRITGHTEAGVFYGTRTLLQLLAAGDRLPAGSTTDVPTYRERGVGVCACYNYTTEAWLDRLIKDMAYLKLNALHLELKVKSSEYPKINTFSYYTPDEIQRLVALAARYHITVTPEINSPGHMDPYIENYHDLQLVGTDGKPDPTRLDVTKPEAFTFYTHLIDADLKLFPGPYFHMGADEYMIGSAYANYPQLLAYAREKFGPNATPQDAYIDFINRVDDYVRSKGRILRIWNDGLTGANTIKLNSDIVVEYWVGERVTPQDLLDAGHTVTNASDALYYVRGSYQPNSQSLYDNNWSPVDFPGQTVRAGQPGVSGAELMVWPDNYGAETENQTQQRLFMPLRVLSQATWGSPHPAAGYAGFQSLARELGHAPGWGPAWTQPLPADRYVIRNADSGGVLGTPGADPGSGLTTSAGGSDSWGLQPTDDGYYRIVSADGLCAAVDRGVKNGMGVVEQIGAAVTQETCSSHSQVQKWQLDPVPGGYRIINAITQQVVDLSGRAVVQRPRDVVQRATWRIDYASTGIAVTAGVGTDTVYAGESVPMTVTVRNRPGKLAHDVTATVEAPEGWTVTPATVSFGALGAGRSASATATLTAPADATAGTAQVTVTVDYRQGDEHRQTSTTLSLALACGPVVHPTAVTHVDSQETVGENGRATNAIDQNPATFWDTEWLRASPPHPHEIVVDLGAERNVCAVLYLPRQDGNPNGTVKGYQIYLGTNGTDWGQPVAQGNLDYPDGLTLQTIAVPPTSARYLRFVATSEVNGQPWASMAELSVRAR